MKGNTLILTIVAIACLKNVPLPHCHYGYYQDINDMVYFVATSAMFAVASYMIDLKYKSWLSKYLLILSLIGFADEFIKPFSTTYTWIDYAIYPITLIFTFILYDTQD